MFSGEVTGVIVGVLTVLAILTVFPPGRAFLLLMLNGLRLTLGVVFSLPFRFQFVLVWFLLVLFLYFNAGAFYEDAEGQRALLTVYLVSLAFVFSQTRERNPLIGISLAEFILTFLVWLGLGAAVFKFVAPFTVEQAPLTTATLGLVMTHALVIAIGEELLFRYAIPSLIPGPRIVAQTLSAIVFGAMHFWAYGGSVPNMMFAASLGFVFGSVTVFFRNGLIIAMALHTAWNLASLGVL